MKDTLEAMVRDFSKVGPCPKSEIRRRIIAYIQSMNCKLCGQQIKEEQVIQKGKDLVWGPNLEAMTWDAAKKEEKDGWRLPTAGELLLAYEQKVEGFSAGYYWSATKYSTNYARFVDFTDGSTDYSYKGSAYSVRCVRESAGDDRLVNFTDGSADSTYDGKSNAYEAKTTS